MKVRAKLHLPIDQWPSEDRLLWERAIADDDPFGEAAAARLAAASKHQYLFAWRRFLGFLFLEDAAALKLSAAERLTKERVRAFAAHLARTNIPRSVAIQVDALYKAARVVLPDHDLAWLKAIKARLHAAAPVQHASGPAVTSLQVLKVGLSLMDQKPLIDRDSLLISQAISYRDGLMIALLAFAPIRRKNLAELEIERHLIEVGDQKYIIIPASDTKTRNPIEFAIPTLLLPYFETYLSIVRPRLLKETSCRILWIGPRGSALRYGSIGDIVARHTRRVLGIRLTPHDTRDAAATTWAIADPEKIRTATDLLSHSNCRTTQKHYNRARQVEASRAYSEIIRNKRIAPRRRAKLNP